MRRHVAEALGHGGLQVEHQPVLAPPGDHVQARADQLQHAFVALQLAHLERRDQAVRGELAARSGRGRRRARPRSRSAGRAGRPGFPCSSARASRACSRTSGGAGASPASWRAGRPWRPSPCAVALRKAVKTLARRRTRKRDSSSAVCTVTSARAIATHSSTVRTLEPISRPMSQQAVMKRSVAWRMRSRPLRAVAGQEHQHVDVGVREQLAAAVAADRDQRGAGRHAAALPQLEQRLVDVAGQGRGSGGSAAARGRPRRGEALEQGGLAVAEARAQRGRRCARRGVAPGRRRATRRRVDASTRPRRLRSAGATKAGGGGDAGRERQHLVAGVGDEHGVLPLRRQRAVAW